MQSDPRNRTTPGRAALFRRISTAAVAAALFAPAARAAGYSLQVLPQRTALAWATAINSAGVAVGQDGEFFPGYGPAVWLPGPDGYAQAQLPRHPLGGYSWANGINDDGVIAGFDGGCPNCWPPIRNPKPTAVLWVPSEDGYRQVELPCGRSGGGRADAINNAGLVAGICGYPDAVAVVWKPGAQGYAMTPLPRKSGFAEPHAVRDDGVVVGMDGYELAIWTPGPDGAYSETAFRGAGNGLTIAYGISDDGVVAGFDQYRPAVWAPSGGSYAQVTLASTSGCNSWPLGSGADGTVAGFDCSLPVVWAADSYAKRVLPTLSGSGNAYAVNASGLVAGSDGASAAVWTPSDAAVPPAPGVAADRAAERSALLRGIPSAEQSLEKASQNSALRR